MTEENVPVESAQTAETPVTEAQNQPESQQEQPTMEQETIAEEE